MPTIKESDQYPELIELFIENELEFTESDKHSLNKTTKCWEASDNGKLIGGCVVSMREGEYILEGIATDPSYRELGLGKQLLSKVLTYLKTIDARTLYLCAKAPGFFKSQGFESIERENAPKFGCIACDQFGKKCFPEVMVKSL